MVWGLHRRFPFDFILSFSFGFVLFVVFALGFGFGFIIGLALGPAVGVHTISSLDSVSIAVLQLALSLALGLQFLLPLSLPLLVRCNVRWRCCLVVSKFILRYLYSTLDLSWKKHKNAWQKMIPENVTLFEHATPLPRIVCAIARRGS